MTRWDAGKESIEAFAEELAQHDDDGITVVPFGPSFEVIDGVTPGFGQQGLQAASSRTAAPIWPLR